MAFALAFALATTGSTSGIALTRLCALLFTFLVDERGCDPAEVAATVLGDYQSTGRSDVPKVLAPHAPSKSSRGRARSWVPKRQARHVASAERDERLAEVLFEGLDFSAADNAAALLDTAIRMEEQTRAVFQDRANAEPEGIGKELLRELAAEEEAHAAFLRRERARLFHI